MKTPHFLPMILLLVLTFSACMDNSTENLVSTQHSVASTQISDVRASATVEQARMQTTLDYASTRASLASTQGAFLQLTLVARGTPIEYLQTEQANVLARYATPTLAPQGTGAFLQLTLVARGTPIEYLQTEQANVLARYATPTLAPQGTADGSVVSAPPTAQPTAIIVTPLVLTSVPTVDSTLPRLENIVMATNVGADDCALDATTTFSVNTPQIYVVARAVNIPPNTRLSSRWLYNGQEVITYDFTKDFLIESACIWFFIDPIDVVFQAGEWGVELAIGGTPVAPPTTFVMN
jgi:hypothetical protein